MVNPLSQYPVMGADGEVWPHTVFLKNVIHHPNIHIGDYTYYNDFRKSIEDVRQLLFPYLHENAPERVFIGKFVQIAHGSQLITSSANHQMDGFSTYPFCIFGEPWSLAYQPHWPNKGDNKIGNDVWLGHESLIMPGITIGNGAIVAARSVVTQDVPAYSIVGGNPAKVIRFRFSDSIIEELEKIAWWDWPIETITKNIAFIVGADIERLKECVL